MRVSHFAHSDAGSGASANALRLHRALFERGVESRLWVAEKRSLAPNVTQLRHAGFVMRRWRELEPWLESRLLDRLVPGREKPLSSGLLGYDPVPIVRADRPDIVQLHWLGCATLRIDRLPSLKVPIVWRLADMWAFCGVEHLCGDPDRFLVGASQAAAVAPPVDALISRYKQHVYDHIDDLTIVCASRWMADLAGRSRLLQGRPIEIIPTGCDTELYRPLDWRMCREILGLPQDRGLVLAGATNVTAHHKGFDLLVDAVDVLAAQKQGFQVVLFGPNSGEMTRRFGGSALDLGPLGDPLHLALVYAACDVFVAPSRIENLANTVLEAMACGTPCVAFSIGGMPDAIGHRESGYLAKAFDVADLANGIRWTLEHPEPHALRERCRRVIEARFSQAGQTSRFLELYERVLGAQ